MTVTPTLRLGYLKASDLAQVAAMEREAFPLPLSLDQVTRLWADPATCYLGCRRGRQLAAFFGFTVHGPTAHVIANVTRPAWRGRGLATALLSAGEEEAWRRGARWFLGEVRASNHPQLRLLERLGWTVVGTAPGFFADGEDARIVWRLLAPPQSPP